MSAIVEELTIEAAPQRVWGAITQQDEIVQWWAYEARVMRLPDRWGNL